MRNIIYNDESKINNHYNIVLLSGTRLQSQQQGNRKLLVFEYSAITFFFNALLIVKHNWFVSRHLYIYIYIILFCFFLSKTAPDDLFRRSHTALLPFIICSRYYVHFAEWRRRRALAERART